MTHEPAPIGVYVYLGLFAAFVLYVVPVRAVLGCFVSRAGSAVMQRPPGTCMPIPPRGPQ